MHTGHCSGRTTVEHKQGVSPSHVYGVGGTTEKQSSRHGKPNKQCTTTWVCPRERPRKLCMAVDGLHLNNANGDRGRQRGSGKHDATRRWGRTRLEGVREGQRELGDRMQMEERPRLHKHSLTRPRRPASLRPNLRNTRTTQGRHSDGTAIDNEETDQAGRAAMGRKGEGGEAGGGGGSTMRRCRVTPKRKGPDDTLHNCKNTPCPSTLPLATTG